MPVAQIDPVFEGVEGGPGSLVKFNPLSDVTSQEVWNFLRIMVGPLISCLATAFQLFIVPHALKRELPITVSDGCKGNAVKSTSELTL